jgi:hypothetical protein
MDMRWFAEFEAKDEDAQKKTRDTVRAAKHVLDAAISIMEKEMASLERPKIDDYDCPSWSHRQAHANGELAAMNKMKQLLTIKG